MDAPGLWTEMNERARTPVADLTDRQVPKEPGVYALYRDGDPVYVGKASSLRDRFWKAHMGTGPDLSRSALRRNVAQHLGFAHSAATMAARPPAPPALTDEQLAATNAWVLECEVAWIVCSSPAEAGELEDRMKQEWMPPLTKR